MLVTVTPNGKGPLIIAVIYFTRKIQLRRQSPGSLVLDGGTEISVQPFSFVSHNIAQQHATLRDAHIFWFAGAHETDVNDLAAHALGVWLNTEMNFASA